MINDSIDNLIESISNSNDYKKYLEISSALKDNDEVNKLLDEIRCLQKESVNLEYNKDKRYKEVDIEIDKKVKYLESIPVYKEYLNRMNEVNDIISGVSDNISKYIEEVV